MKIVFKKGIFNLISLTAALFLFFSCASTPSKKSSYDDGEEIAITVSRKSSNKEYFASIPSDVMTLVSDGSAQSLKRAASLLHKTAADEYSVQEKVLLYTMAEIMRIVWPSEQITWDVPEVTVANSYTGAIDSVRRGFFDSSTGNTDFLTIVLPTMLLLTAETRTDYFEQAENSLRQALEINRQSTLVNYLYGVLKNKLSEYAAALDYVKTAARNSPDSFEIRSLSASIEYSSRNYREALLQAESLLDRAPQNVALLGLCADSAFMLNDMEKAESYVVRVLLVEPENMNFVLMRAKILMARGEYIRASSLLDVYSRSDINSKDYLLLRAQLQRDWNKNNTASGETVAKALMYYPEDIDVLLFAAEIAATINYKIGGFTARELSDKVLQKDPENIQAMQICISEMVKNAEWNAAYQMSSKLVKSKNVSDSLLQNHIDICLALKNNSEAFNMAQNLYNSNPNDENAQQAYIKVLVAVNQRSQASQLINSLMPTASSRMKSFLYYELSFFTNDEDAVLSNLRSSLTANPRNKDALYRLYEIYYNKKDWRRAQYYLKQVVALDPTNSTYLSKNAELDALLGK